jgi:hypothetical protein
LGELIDTRKGSRSRFIQAVVEFTQWKMGKPRTPDVAGVLDCPQEDAINRELAKSLLNEASREGAESAHYFDQQPYRWAVLSKSRENVD